MKKMFLLGMAMVMSLTMLMAQTREGLTEYKLDNGLTVMLWEDHDQKMAKTGKYALITAAIAGVAFRSNSCRFSIFLVSRNS